MFSGISRLDSATKDNPQPEPSEEENEDGNKFSLVLGYVGKETLLGRILGHHRKDIVLASKFGLPMGEGPYLNGAGRHYILRAVEDSLRRLRTDHLDLYQVHRPDPATPIEETLRALDDLVRDGKVRYVGCSNFAGWQLAEAEWAMLTECAASDGVWHTRRFRPARASADTRLRSRQRSMQDFMQDSMQRSLAS